MLSEIRVEQSFVLYANCSVIYNGRAKSTLMDGNYLIMHKNDGTLRIDGGELCNPLNYQPPGAILKKDGNKLISLRKNESIEIIISKIIYYKELKDWSNNKIEIIKTERELRDHIYDNISSILNCDVVEKYREFKTPVGDIDVLAIDSNNIYHVIEVKRGKANLSACSQLSRYYQYFVDIGKAVKDYIMSPDINKNALKYMEQHSKNYIKVDHSI